METTLDEKPVRDIWQVLRKIKAELNKRIDEGNLITYTVRLYPQNPNAPHPTVEQDIVSQLKDLEVVAEVKERDDFEVFSETFKRPTRITPPTSQKKFDAWRRKQGNPKLVGTTIYLKVNSKFDKLYNKYKKKNQEYDSKSPLDKLGRFCRFENNSLIVELPDGSSAPIDFNTRSGSRGMINVFEIIFEHWRTSKETELKDGWLETLVTKEIIRSGLEKKGKKDLHSKFITNNISYIRNLKIKQSELSGVVRISNFNPKIDGWLFGIKKL